MLFADVLSVANACLTWSVQVGCAYFVIWTICRFLSSPRVKVGLWSILISAAVVYWIAVWLLPTVSPPPSSSGVRAAVSVVDSSQNPVQTHARKLPWSFELPRNDVWQLAGVWAGLFYLLIVSALLLRWLNQARLLPTLLRDSEEPPPDISSAFVNLCDELGIRSCKLHIGSTLRSPATAYWWRPCVFLPSDLVSHVSFEQLLDMLRHELIHVRRRDYLWDRALSLGCRIAFFHPALWMAYHDLRRERELVCDQEAAGHVVEDRLRYADSLLTFARWRRSRTYPEPALEFASLASPLASRVHVLLRPPSPNPGRQSVLTGFFVVAGIVVLSVLLPAVGIDLHWAADQLMAPPTVLTTTESAITLRPVTVVRKSRRNPVNSAPPLSVSSEAIIAELPSTLPVSQPLPAILEPTPAVPPVSRYAVSLKALAGSRPSFPAYAASLRDQKPEVQWNAFPATASRKPKELSGIRKTFFGAAVFGLTYLATEATESEKEGPSSERR